VPGDGKQYNQTVRLSSVRVTPFNEPNDVVVPDPTDQPTGCTQYMNCALTSAMLR
jgi:hypothetical protein